MYVCQMSNVNVIPNHTLRFSPQEDSGEPFLRNYNFFENSPGSYTFDLTTPPVEWKNRLKPENCRGGFILPPSHLILS